MTSSIPSSVRIEEPVCVSCTFSMDDVLSQAEAIIVSETAPVETLWYDISGRRLSSTVTGINIRIDRLSDGTMRRGKVYLP